LENKTDRRSLLKLMAAATIGAIASAIKIPKAKAEGETLHVGDEYDTAYSRTMIKGDTGSGNSVIEGEHTGTGYGVRGRAAIGIGVAGNALSGTGVVGFSPDGTGVHGDVISGRGVVGGASASSGTTYGVDGWSDSTSGKGVRGWATAGSGTTFGVYGESYSTSGTGVLGKASASSGSTRGVYGQSNSTSGVGVYGLHAAGSGAGYGLLGKTNSSSGYALRTVGTSAFGGTILPTSDNAYNCGSSSKRWKLVRAVTITPGDLVFENGVKATEEGDGLAFINPKGSKIAVLDREGNLHIKGQVIQDL